MFSFPLLKIRNFFSLSLLLYITHASILVAAEEVIEVIGQKRPAPYSQINVDKTAYTGIVTTIERSEFEDRFTPLTDILSDVPSVQIKSSGGLGSYSSTSLRGSTGKQVNIFLDGLLLNSPFSGNAHLNNIPTSILESIDVYPNFTPIELSTSNLAGAISLSSRSLPNDEYGLQASLGYGSFNTKNGAMSGWTNIHEWQLLGAISALDSDNDYTVNDEDFATHSDSRINSQYEASSVFLKSAREWELLRVQMLYQAQESDSGLPTAKNRLADNATLKTKSQQFQSVFDYSLHKWNITHRVFIAEEHSDFNDPNGTIGLQKDHIVTEQNGYGLFNFAKLTLEQNSFSVGLNLRNDKAFQEDLSINEVQADIARESYVFSASHHLIFNGSNKFTTTLRQYAYNDKVKQRGSQSNAKDDSSHAFAWQTGFNFPLTTHWSLLSNFGETVRLPTLLEKFGNSGLYVGNENLKEETALVGDIGLQYENKQFNIYSVIFSKKLDDGIYTIYNSQGIGSPENIGASKIIGNETSFNYQITKAITWTINTTVMDSENISDIKAFKGKKMPGIYHINYGSSLSYKLPFLALKANYQFYDLLYYNPANAVKAETKNVLDLNSTFYFEPFTLDFTIRNALDDTVMDYNRMPTPGRSYYLTATINL